MMQRRIVMVLCLLGFWSFAISVFTSILQSLFISKSYGNLKCLGSACMQYVQDHGNRLPPMKNTQVMRKALAPYIEDGTDNWWEVPGQSGVFYEPNPALSGKHINSLNDVYKTVLLFEPTERLSFGKGRRVAYATGIAQFVYSESWPEVARKSGIVLVPGYRHESFWEPGLLEGMGTIGLEMLAIGSVLGFTTRLTRKRH